MSDGKRYTVNFTIHESDGKTWGNGAVLEAEGLPPLIEAMAIGAAWALKNAPYIAAPGEATKVAALMGSFATFVEERGAGGELARTIRAGDRVRVLDDPDAGIWTVRRRHTADGRFELELRPPDGAPGVIIRSVTADELELVEVGA